MLPTQSATPITCYLLSGRHTQKFTVVTGEALPLQLWISVCAVAATQRWSSQSSNMQHSYHRKRLNDNELTHFLIVLNVTVTVTQTYRHLKYSVRLQMTNYLVKLFPILTTFCTLCCHNITVLDVGRTHIYCLGMTVICVTVTSYTRMMYSSVVDVHPCVLTSAVWMLCTYRVGQIKWHHFTFLLVTHECIHKILWFLAHINYIMQKIRC